MANTPAPTVSSARPDAPQPIDPRVAFAAERTLLAWMRTGLSMMGFGFVVARFGLFLRQLTAAQPGAPTGAFSRWMGVALVLLGVVISAFAALIHALSLNDNATVDARRRFSGWIAVALTSILAILGVIMAVYLMVMK